MAKKNINYLILTDTEITDLLDNFCNMLCFIDSDIFLEYIDNYHSYDKIYHDYNKKELQFLFINIIEYIDKKYSKLRVRTNLKLDHVEIIKNVMNDMVISDDTKFWIKIMFDFYFSKYEIYEHIDSMEENYASMYNEYLNNYDINN